MPLLFLLLRSSNKISMMRQMTTNFVKRKTPVSPVPAVSAWSHGAQPGPLPLVVSHSLAHPEVRLQSSSVDCPSSGQLCVPSVSAEENTRSKRISPNNSFELVAT